MIKDKFNVVSTEKNVNLVGKSSVTNLESRDKTDVIINDKNDKKSVDVERKKKRSVIILGDSLVKDVEQHKLRKGLHNKERIFIKHFSGATVDDMKNYILPSKKYENDLVILHVGTNDLRNPKEAKEIANEIIELAIDTKNEKNEIMVSGIVPRRDNLNEKAKEVNILLKDLCCVYNFHFIDNTNVNKDTHLNMGGLHLNYNGTYVLGGNFVNAIRL